MNCGDYSTLCVRKGYCENLSKLKIFFYIFYFFIGKPNNSNFIDSCSSCQTCSEGSSTCPTGYTCSRDTYCTDNVKKCSTNYP